MDGIGTTTLVLVLFLTFTLSSSRHSHMDIGLGESMNIFENYGTLLSTMKVLPLEVPGSWIFTQTTEKIFSRRSYVVHRQNLTEWRLSVYVCRDFDELLNHFFRNYSIEGVENTWKAFAGNFQKEDIAWPLGIEAKYVGQGYRYIFWELSRYRSKGNWSRKWYRGHRWHFPQKSGTILKEHLWEKVRKFVPEDVDEVNRFIDLYGSHYISSYSTGDSLYRTYVYNLTSDFHQKKVLKRRKFHLTDKLPDLLPVKYLVHSGNVQVRSGNKNLSRWLSELLEGKSQLTLFKMFKSSDFRQELDEHLTESALLSIKLRSISHHFPEKYKEFFESVVSNRIALWDINL